MPDIELIAINKALIRVDAERGIQAQLGDRYTFAVPGYQHMPLFKRGLWDGKMRLFKNGVLPRGLLKSLKEFADEQGYTIAADDELFDELGAGDEISPDELAQEIASFNLPETRQPRDFQIEALRLVAERKRCILVSATGSGKSLMIYLICRYFDQDSILLVVPTITLVSQMYADFESYSTDWDVDEHCQKIQGGLTKVHQKRIIISTWQSIFKQPAEYFSPFTVLIVDEAHTATAESIKSISDKSTNAHIRVGVTGTLQNTICHAMVLEGIFGKPETIATTRELIDAKILAGLKVHMLKLEYGKLDAKCVNEFEKSEAYQREIDFVHGHQTRLKYVANLAKGLEGNTLILVSKIKDYGTPLYSLLKQTAPTKQVYFVSGSMKAEDRLRIQKLAETRSDIVIIATYQVFSTGVNIVNLSNVIFGSPAKSEIRVLQSIGRGLRRGTNKTEARIIDIVDDFSMGKKTKVKILARQAEARAKYYAQQQFDVRFTAIKNFT